MDVLIFTLAPFAIIGIQLWAAIVWRGVWRWLAAAPLLIVAAYFLLIMAQISIDPTSHNLWPLELAMIAVIGLPVVGILWVVRLVARA
jgi:hypothetical protein